jgi:hypothetical protein
MANLGGWKRDVNMASIGKQESIDMTLGTTPGGSTAIVTLCTLAGIDLRDIY